MKPTHATAIGLVAILLWSCLALLTTLTAGIPPFQLMALSFAVAFMASSALLGLRGGSAFRAWQQPWPVWAVGFSGIFAYHALYFYALKTAPAAEASLIAYLWPLFIVLGSALATGTRPSARHWLGAMLGLAGSALILLRNGSAATTVATETTAQTMATTALPASVYGYLAAFTCAIVWAVYSVANRRFSGVPSSVIGGICGLVALAGLLCHGLWETTVWPSAVQWVAIVGLGLGPGGLAFFAWDHGTKYGNLPMLGALSYLAPLVSTLLLIATGQTPATAVLAAAGLCIIAGAVIAAVPSKSAG